MSYKLKNIDGVIKIKETMTPLVQFSVKVLQLKNLKTYFEY